MMMIRGGKLLNQLAAMALQFVYCFFYFLFPLMALYFAHGEDDCTKGIYCGNNLGYLEFPFTEHTKPQCGLIAVNCNDTLHPKVQLGKGGNWYPLVRQVKWEAIITIFLEDLKLQGLIDSHNCSIVNYSLPTFQNSPSITFQVHPPDYNILKCNHSEGKQQICNYGRYKNNCNGGLSLYYKPPWTPEDPKCTVPNSCTPLQMPIIGQIYDKLTAQFEVELQVSEACYECYSGGGRCATAADANINEFRCEKGKSTWKLITLITVLGGAALISIVIFVVWRRKKGNKGYSRNESSNNPTSDHSMFCGIPVFSYSELEEATNNFDPSKKLGEGISGTVYYGKLQDGREVAVKRFYEQNCKRMEQFVNEILILTRLRHRNLVTLYGCTSRHSRELLLVYEYIPNGTVADHLHGKRAKDGLLTWPIRIKIAVETATALSYLHATDIIHRDVKTSNILLDDNFRVKVADFGISKLFRTNVTHATTTPQGTPGYVDPEYHECYQLTYKSDVYSLGVVLVELISSMPAVDIHRHAHEINLARLAMNKILTGAIDELIDNSLGYETDDEMKRMTTLMAELAFQCLQPDKDSRPTMDHVLESLKEIRGDDETLNGEEIDLSKCAKLNPQSENEEELRKQAVHQTWAGPVPVAAAKSGSWINWNRRTSSGPLVPR